MNDYDRGVLEGQESLDRELDACKDKLEAAEVKLAEVERALQDELNDSYRDAELNDLGEELKRVEKERDNITAAHLETLDAAEAMQSSMDRARELAHAYFDVSADDPMPLGTAEARLREVDRLLSGDE